MKSLTRSPTIRRLTQQARQLGYQVRFAEFCEDATTPGMLGVLAGKCDPNTRTITVATWHGNKQRIEAVLSHELEHAGGADRGTDYPELGLRCGGRIPNPWSETK